MKTIKLLAAVLLFAFAGTIQAQTADEIVANYFENTGGLEAWNSIKSMKATGKAGMGPQEFQFTQYAMADGRMAVEIELQGQKFTPQAFDGESAWGTNFQTMQAEAQDSESSANYKNESRDIIDTFLNYQDKGYTLEKMEDETVEGVDCFKIKVNKKPSLDEGKEIDNFAVFFFDKENFVPIMSETTVNAGPQKGVKTQTLYSDYTEVGPIYFAFSITSKFNGQVGQTLKIENMEINPELDEAIFKMPVKE